MNFYHKLPPQVDNRALFAFDKKNDNGAKCYVVSNYVDFLQKLGNIAESEIQPSCPQFSEHCAYELMREGRLSKLFLDLEYDKTCNDLLEMSILKLVIETTREVLKKIYKFELKKVLIFTASNHKKCSFHVIFPHAIFNNYQTLHAFVRDKLIPAFKIKHPNVLRRDASSTSFIDPLGGRHRAFRLPYQHKKVADIKSRRPLIPLAPIPVQSIGTAAWIKQMLQSCIQYVDARSYVLNRGEVLSLPLYDNRINSAASNSLAEPIVKWVGSQRHPITGRSRNMTAFSLNMSRQQILMSSADHFCEYKNGAHGHNFVFYVIDLNNRFFYQSCYEGASCHGHGGKRITYAIPDAVLNDWDRENNMTSLITLVRSIV